MEFDGDTDRRAPDRPIHRCRTAHRTVIHHVQLAAPPNREAESRAFWVGVLGFAEIEKPEALADRGGCWFRREGIEVHVGVDDDFHAAQKAHPGFLVRDLDELAQRLKDARGPVTWD